MSLVCPSCSATAVQRHRMVYEAGTASIRATTIGLGHHFVAAGTSGQQQTELARKVAPPGRAPTYFVLGPACFGVLLVATGWPLFGAILAGVFGLATAEFVRQNKVLYPGRLARYERKWICLACGHEWIADEP